MADPKLQDVKIYGTSLYFGEIEKITQDINDLCDQVRQERIRAFPEIWNLNDSLNSSIVKEALRNMIQKYQEVK
jgi:hypothetical protein